jgi:hypothetical protein
LNQEGTMKIPLEYTGSDPEPGSPPSFKMLVDWCEWAACAEAIEAGDELPARVLTGIEAMQIAMELPPNLAMQPIRNAIAGAIVIDWIVVDMRELLTRFSRPAERAVA